MSVQHMNPFRDTVDLYRKAGWPGTLPLPYKQKQAPPTGTIGRKAPHPSPEQIKEWKERTVRQNICNRLAGIDDNFEVMGIDVDHYFKGNKQKRGADQLKKLEEKLGPLPDTWVSGARIDGFSGIRYFLVPKGFEFMGQVDADIECIQKKHRFAVQWPSIHPSGETYWWFPPGAELTKEGRNAWDGQIPDPKTFPKLPQKWFDYLTQGGMKANPDERIDMDSSVDEIYEWAYGLFHGDPDSAHMCRLYQDKVKKQIEDIKNEATSHDKIVKAHYNLLRLAAEGHVGWTQAIHEVEKFWAEDVISRDKRGIDEVNAEIWRSRTNALRKIKAQIDERIKIGAAPVDKCCEDAGNICENYEHVIDGMGVGPPPIDPLADVARGPIKPVGEYRMNDDGNAEHLVDMFCTLKDGASFRFADGYGWIVWHDCENPYWEHDRDGVEIMRQMWQRVRNRQEEYVDVLKQDYTTKLDLFDKQTPGISKADVEVAKRKYYDWKAFAEKSGNNYTANNALRAAQSVPGVRISVNNLDSNALLLGVENGVLELSNDDVRLRKAEQRDYITMNTHIPYEKPSDLSLNTWNEYLETFLPDLELRNITQIVLGHTLIGGNPQKKIIILKGQPHTGKSTMIDGIQAALGDYAGPINETVFQSGQFSEVLVSALNKRVAHVSEFDSSIELSAAVVKRLTGGDSISQAIKYSNEVRSGTPQFTVILGTNGVPKIVGADKALQERLFVIPFETVPYKIDYNQRRVVQSVCGPAVLYWLVEGYLQYNLTKTLPSSKLIKDKTEEFMSDLDETATFISEALIKHDKIGMRIDWKQEPEWRVKREDLYKHYENWCEINKISERHRLTPRGFTQKLRSLGIPGTDGTKTMTLDGVSARWWFGVRKRKLRAGGNVFQMPKMSHTSDIDDQK